MEYYCLGLEGSANKLSAGIVTRDGKLLAHARDTYNAPTGQGFRPQEMTKHHRDLACKMIKQALDEAGIEIRQVSLIAYTRGPGMGGPLAAVELVAKTLALLYNIPLVPVNHCVAHVEMGRLVTGLRNPVVLYASGGNTQIIAFAHGRYRIFGEALDVAVGNCLDRFARDCKISNEPAPGRNIERSAEAWKRKIEEEKIELKDQLVLDIPIAVKGMDISCSGLNSWLRSYISKNIEPHPMGSPERTDLVNKLCYSLQEYLFSALVEIAERAAAHLGVRDFLLVGGVGSNVRLQQMLAEMARERGGSVGAMDERYCIDNGAMIAWTGVLAHSHGSAIDPEKADVDQRWRTDQVQITWRSDNE